MRHHRYGVALAALSTTLAMGGLFTGGSALAGTRDTPPGARAGGASAAGAPIHPGVYVTSARVRCEAGFVLRGPHGVYLAVPGSCTGVGGGGAMNGCQSAQIPVGFDQIRIQGARHYGTLVYSSYVRMQLTGETRAARCNHNSLSLIQVDPRDADRVDPTVPAPVGGPTGLARSAPNQLDNLTLYAATRSQAQAMQTSAAGWAHQAFPEAAVTYDTVGAPVLDPRGRAVGMVTEIPSGGMESGPIVIDDLARELRALNATPGFRRVHLVAGRQRFTPPPSAA